MEFGCNPSRIIDIRKKGVVDPALSGNARPLKFCAVGKTSGASFKFHSRRRSAVAAVSCPDILHFMGWLIDIILHFFVDMWLAIRRFIRDSRNP